MSLNGVNNQIANQAVTTPSFAAGAEEQPEVYVEPKKTHTARNVLVGLALIGAATWGVIKFKNKKALEQLEGELKPIIEKVKTKDGGEMVKQIEQMLVQGADGKDIAKIVKRTNTYTDKEGNKAFEMIHDFATNERISVYYNKDGSVRKTVLGRMKQADKNAKSLIEQSQIYTFERNGDQLTTNQQLFTYGGKKSYITRSASKTETIVPKAAEPATEMSGGTQAAGTAEEAAAEAAV